MRVWLVGVSVLAALAAGAVEAAPNGMKSARRVQLVVMDAARREAPEKPGSAPAEAISGGDVDLAPAAFRVHDLSRRWVEYQMAESFAAGPQNGGNGGISQDEPALGSAQPALSLAASVPVPQWMRGASPFAAPLVRFVPGCVPMSYRPTGFLRPDIEARRAGYYRMMSGIACEYGVPVGLFDALIIRESQYRPYVYSPKSAFGLTQLMPGTAAGLGVNRYDIEGNLRGGAKYLRQQLDRFGHYHLALAAYNAGPGRVRDGLVPRIAETQAYVDNVLLNWSRLTGLSRSVTITSGSTPYRRLPTRQIGRAATVSTF